jgi:hypothetical protein
VNKRYDIITLLLVQERYGKTLKMAPATVLRQFEMGMVMMNCKVSCSDYLDWSHQIS